MKIIKEFDYRDYKADGTVGVRPSVRAIIIRGNKLAMVYSEKFNRLLSEGLLTENAINQ